MATLVSPLLVIIGRFFLNYNSSYYYNIGKPGVICTALSVVNQENGQSKLERVYFSVLLYEF